MMFFINSILTLIFLFNSLHLVFIESTLANAADKDPFRSLGIPDLDPKALLAELDKENNKKPDKEGLPQLKSIDDLPNFLKNSKLNEEEGIKVLTRFLIQDDFTLKKFGVVYDQSGFDGISSTERIAPVGTEDRLQQRARSAANIWFKQKYTKLEYDAYGAEGQMDEIIPNWRIYKVLMIGKNGENTFVKVCLPLDESETALCSDKDESCGERATYVEREKKKNEDYIEKIKSNNFFKKKSNLGAVKLLPGEKIIAKDQGKELVIDSHSITNNGVTPPPPTQAADPLLAAFKNRSNPTNLTQQPGPNSFSQGTTFNQPQPSLPIVNGINPNFTINKGPGNLNLNPTPAVNGYNFKQKELTQNPQAGVNPVTASSGLAAPQTNMNNDLYNEIMQMKMQIAQLMNTIKQKDQVIADQNNKLSVNPNLSTPSNQHLPIQTNSIPSPVPQFQNQMINNNGMPQMGMNGMMNINNSIPGQVGLMNTGDQKTNFLGYPQYNQGFPNQGQFGNYPSMN